MKTRLVLTLLALLAAGNAPAQGGPKMSEVDRVRLAEAFRLGESLGDRVWRGWNKAPFAVLLVTPEHEFLIRHPRPSKDFTRVGYDSLLKSDVYARKREFATNLLATFPAVGGVSTVVIGRAENTNKKTSTPWVVTVLHEHFHQLQDSQPGFYAETEALGLSRGDNTGMWMLNYPFPYDAPEVRRQASVLGRLLAEALRGGESDLPAKLAAYLEARRRLQATLNPDDYKYLSFQLWKEGMARYTEHRVAEFAAAEYKPSKEFRALKDFTPFEAVAVQLRGAILKELSDLRLEEYKRVAFYPLGAGEGLLLDRVSPRWRARYFTDKFFVEKYFNAAK